MDDTVPGKALCYCVAEAARRERFSFVDREQTRALRQVDRAGHPAPVANPAATGRAEIAQLDAAAAVLTIKVQGGESPDQQSGRSAVRCSAPEWC